MSRWALFDPSRLRMYRKLMGHSGAGRLALFFVVATLFVFVIAGGNATAEVLFQSPQSPPAEPEPTATPPPPAPTPVPPSPTPEPVVPLVEESLEAEPTEAPPPTEEPLPIVEEAAAEHQAVESIPVPPTEEPTTEPELQAEAVVQPQPIQRSREREVVAEPEGGRNFILDQAELIDTVAVSGAYLWLCCGFGLLLMAPLFLLLLYVRGRSRVLEDEGF